MRSSSGALESVESLLQGICSKLNVIVRLEFEPFYEDVTVEQRDVCHKKVLNDFEDTFLYRR